MTEERRKMTTIKIPTLLWYGDKKLTLSFPAKWNVTLYPMNGERTKPLSKEGIKSALSNPIGSKTIRALAENRKEAVIIFDDMSRPTKVYQLLPYVIDELNRGGISNDHIRFISALGTHGAMDRQDFVKKLGEKVVEEFSVFNHNPFFNLTDVGTNSRGTPVKINSEVMSCDLKIGIGTVVPHGQSGFGGGAKIVLPGVAGAETIIANHKLPVKWGLIEENLTRLDMEEAARLAGLDVKLDTVLNGRAEIANLYVGEVVAESREAVKKARETYATSIPKGFDIVIANTYFKSNEPPLAIRFVRRVIRDGGTAVIIVNDPKGPVTHYLEGKFGKNLGGVFYYGPRKLEGIGKAIIYCPQKMKDPWYQLFDPEQQISVKTWKEVVEELRSIHGDKARVAVVPDATVQIPKEALGEIPIKVPAVV
jgi:nickel-dependent lactate racemase